MQTPNQKDFVKRIITLGIIIGAVGLFILAIWTLWMFKFAELFATCDNNLTVWQRNPGAGSSYKYEIRDNITILKSGLRNKDLDNFLKDNHCTILTSLGG